MKPSSISPQKRQVLLLVGAVLMTILAILLPFLPGPSTKFSLGLSILVQTFGFFGLILIPVGIVWLIGRKKALEKTNQLFWKPGYYFALGISIFSFALLLLVTLGLFMTNDFRAGMMMILLGTIGLNMAYRGLRKMKSQHTMSHQWLPIYAIVIPVVSFFIRTQVELPMSGISRGIAITQGQLIIEALEKYKIAEGQYPETIKSLEGKYFEKIPPSSILGISGFHYYKVGDEFTLSFSQWLDMGSLEEIVLYEKKDLHTDIAQVVAYDYQHDLHRVNSASAHYPSGYTNWTYYHAD